MVNVCEDLSITPQLFRPHVSLGHCSAPLGYERCIGTFGLKEPLYEVEIAASDRLQIVEVIAIND